MSADDTSRNAEAAASGEVWTCPMHPEVQKKEPGRCPKCNMHLVKKAG
jgi:Cu+-exporting ATPase